MKTSLLGFGIGSKSDLALGNEKDKEEKKGRKHVKCWKGRE